MPYLSSKKEKGTETKIIKEDLCSMKEYSDIKEQRKKEDFLIKQKREEEDFLIKLQISQIKQQIIERRKKEDFLLKKKRREEDFLRSKKFVPLEKQIRINKRSKYSSMKEKNALINLNEDFEEDEGIARDEIEIENGMKKEED